MPTENIMNRLANVANRFQGEAPRVLCVCSAGLLRSPTAAKVLSQEPFNFNTRAVGAVPEYALTPLDIVFIDWSDFILVMDRDHESVVLEMAEENKTFLRRPPIVRNLEIPDRFDYGNPTLERLIKEGVEPLVDEIRASAENRQTRLW